MSWVHPDSAKLLEGIGIRLGGDQNPTGASSQQRYDYDEPQEEQFHPPRPKTPPQQPASYPSQQQPASYQQPQRAAPYPPASHSGAAAQWVSQVAQKPMTFDIPADERAGVHAIMVSDGEQGLAMIEEMPPGGQLATNDVDAGDLLRSIDGKPVNGLSLKVIKSLIEGPAGSRVELQFRRRDASEEYLVNVVRTLTMGEDVQIGVYTELAGLLDSQVRKGDGDQGWQRASEGADESEHVSRMMHDEIFARVAELRKDPIGDTLGDLAEQLQISQRENEKFRKQAWEADKIIRDLRVSVAERDAAMLLLREELAFCTRNQMAAVSLTLDEDFDRVAEQPHARAALQDALQQDLARALQVEPTRIEIMGLHKRGGVVVDLCLVPDGSEKSSNFLAQEIRRQADDPRSQLHACTSTKRATKVMNRDPHDWIERLRATCDRLGQDNTVLANDLLEATRHVDEVRRHKDARAAQMVARIAELETEVKRLSAEVDAQAQARKLQVEQLTVVRDQEESKMRGSITVLSTEVSSQDKLSRDLKTELQRALIDLNEAGVEVQRLTTELERCKNNEAQIQAEKIVQQQRHEEVVSVIERALDDAKDTIEKQRRDLSDLDRLQKKLVVQSDELREKQKALEGLKAQSQYEVEALKALHHHEKIQSSAKHEAETNEFVMHLSSAEDTVRALRGELETRLRSQNELLRQMATQEELGRSLQQRNHDLEEQLKHVRAEYDVAFTSIQALQKEQAQTNEVVRALHAENQTLRVEHNAWKRIDKVKLEREMAALEEENEELRRRLAFAPAARNGDNSFHIPAPQDNLHDALMHAAVPHATMRTASGHSAAPPVALYHADTQDVRHVDSGHQAENEQLKRRVALLQAQLEALDASFPVPWHEPGMVQRGGVTHVPMSADASMMAERLAELEWSAQLTERGTVEASSTISTLQRRVAQLEREKAQATAHAQLPHAPNPGAPVPVSHSQGPQGVAAMSVKTLAEIRALTTRIRELELLLQEKEKERRRAVEEAESWKGAMSTMEQGKTNTAPIFAMPNIFAGGDLY
mmetsp:Transcript_70607/g.161874  ORF Transcript_70607/g.161874 Transcript_70607/m.161874 type:complete len:1047 (+) Transcript_70607:76-3216(+)|eukprot:CAMPEP_0180124054 /NCGR_PEP_ID=MMETSP0986-20121125/4444_1 /TAXON_ID=697907 /ORGANISM="non described non described, Strain CCMP2293" /LENGTH=1046 /DNA_ID=CAMNT_0022063363 /DNA_START=80 /DNA_END=3220 /DNA_ORIENTATION=+